MFTNLYLCPKYLVFKCKPMRNIALSIFRFVLIWLCKHTNPKRKQMQNVNSKGCFRSKNEFFSIF